MVAEKVRFMKKQNRGDVISAIKNYCDVGFHTDTHSRHPIVFEYISDLDVVKGAKEIERRERPGLKEVKNTFGYVPSCFGHAGTQWAPHYYPYLRKNGINVYLDSTDLVNIDDSPYWYCGVLSLNNTDKNFIRFDRSSEDPEGSEKLKKRFQDIHDRLQKSGGGAISILWHPHTGINKVYWDALNFSNGQNTPEGNYIQPEQYPLEIKERALQDFESLIKFGSSFKDVRFISATDSLKIYRRDLDIVLDVSGIRKIASALSRSDEISYMKPGRRIHLSLPGILRTGKLRDRLLQESQNSKAGRDERAAWAVIPIFFESKVDRSSGGRSITRRRKGVQIYSGQRIHAVKHQGRELHSAGAKRLSIDPC